eukprot:CAMPEP_0197734912 /NCGR_PEP_ID=MMETSP1435-20131217/78_1 /TAXON_ID=426625 /ORGANISM="Chaetoceros brevis, Strain CCMP164" /LENGTH=220 /DNA_ID=CAMNT_0043322375 /DNA_START=17 /DNA_END=679 /DNA_ORIENTATION=+
MKIACAITLIAGASAFAPAPVAFRASTAVFNGPVKGAGGMADTRDPDAFEHEDPRKSIKAAPSFEEYLKQRDAGAAPAAAAPAPVAAAPVAAAPVYAPPAPVAAAPAPVAAAAPAGAPPSENAFVFGVFDDILWSNENKNSVYDQWDPQQPRSTRNFNPFETFGGNSPDASGIFPGQPRYKDPIRPDVSYAIMQAENAERDARNVTPKFMSCPGAPGCVN